MKKIVIFIILLVIIIWIISIPIISHIYPSLNDRALFGNMFGAVDAIFSAFAFIGVIIAIYLQNQELKLQREELVATRKELKRSAEAQEKSEKIFSKNANLYALGSILDYHLKCMEIKARYDSRGAITDTIGQEAKEIVNKIKNEVGIQ